MNTLIRNILVLCDNIVTLAIAISAQNNNSKNQITTHIFDDYLFNFKIWVENVEANIPGKSSDSLKVLDILRDSAVSFVRKVINNLEMIFKNMSNNFTAISLTLNKHFRDYCD